jgi:hypothetical protein
MKLLKRFSIPTMLALGAFASYSASAQTLVQITAIPSGWLLQNYVPGNATLWFTGSSCNNGQLVLPPTAIQADSDRLWGMILTAKTTLQTVVVYYYVSSGTCYISSYGITN